MSPARMVFAERRAAPWVKLCGVRDAEAARSLAALRPDAIGLNFYAQSKRYVATGIATDICKSLPRQILGVGVFVNATVNEILQIVGTTGLAAVQLHGDEPASLVAELRAAQPELGILRAWRVDEGGLSSLADHLHECGRLTALPDAILVDAKVVGTYGGSGQTAPWELLRDYDRSWPPLILAGGLTPENVAEAVATVHPFGVDTAGGVESSPGVKDPARAAAFIAALGASPS